MMRSAVLNLSSQSPLESQFVVRVAANAGIDVANVATTTIANKSFTFIRPTGMSPFLDLSEGQIYYEPIYRTSIRGLSYI